MIGLDYNSYLYIKGKSTVFTLQKGLFISSFWRASTVSGPIYSSYVHVSFLAIYFTAYLVGFLRRAQNEC